MKPAFASGNFPRRQGWALTISTFCGMVAFSPVCSGVAFSQDADQVLQQTINSHLAAGEYGAALDAVAQSKESPLSEQLNQQIVQAQIDSGDTAGAFALAPAMNRVHSSRRARAQASDEQILSGGSGADYQSLIRLIRTETSGEWIDDTGEGVVDMFDSGVTVDPQGVLARRSQADNTGRLEMLGVSARKASLNEEMAQPSKLRLVSLTRLEEEVARRLQEGKSPVESMQRLAGLSQIQYVFIYPEENEIVLGGPAEGWQYNEVGQPVGISSGKPTLQLDDLVTALRTFSNSGSGIFGCSIDPQPENLEALKSFVATSQSRGPLTPAGVNAWARQIGKQLGKQNITVYGVPANSRVARVLVEADYRMKLIGIGKLEGGSNIPDYFELLAENPELASGNLEALRWWMTMKYDAVLNSPEHDVYEIRGSAVQCKSENQHLAENGERVSTGKAEPINRQFAANFTEHYSQLASNDPVFADLQGIFDLALVAAMIQRDQLDMKAGWDRGVFAAAGSYRPVSYATPKQTESVVNHRVYNGRDVVLQVAGGVTGDILSVLNDSEVRQVSENLEVAADDVKAKQELPVGRWWWDAE